MALAPEEITSEVRADIERFALAVGIDAATVQTRRIDWQQLAKKGAIVEIHLGRYRARETLRLEDLGIEAESDRQRTAYARTLSTGHKRLLPPEVEQEAQQIEDKARKWHEAMSFKTIWGRFVPEQAYAKWAQGNVELCDQYLAFGRSVAARRDELVAEMAAEYREIAPRTYNDLVRNGAVLDKSQPEWVEWYVARQVANVPSAETIAASYTYTWETTRLVLPSEAAADQAKAEAIRLEALEKARLAAEDAMRADLARTEAERSLEGINRFLADVQEPIQARVYELVTAALAGLASGSTAAQMRGKIMALKNLVDEVRTLVFWESPDLTEKIAQLDALLGVEQKKRSKEDLQAVLRDLGAQARLVLLEIDRPPARSARELGIPVGKVALEKAVRRGRGRVITPTPLVLDRAPRRGGTDGPRIGR
jgi:hypothetical protein